MNETSACWRSEPTDRRARRSSARPRKFDWLTPMSVDQLVDRAVPGAERQLAGGLLSDVDQKVGAVRRGARHVGDVDVFKEAQRADAELGAVDQGAVVGVALGNVELAADDVVERRGVADDVDPVDVDPRAFLDVEGDVHRVPCRIWRVARPDVDEGETRGAGGEGQGVGRLFDLLVRVELARLDRQELFQNLRVQLLDVDLDLDLAEVVARALVDHIGHRESVAAGVQFRDRRDDAEVVEAAVAVELPKLFAVVLDPVGVVVVVGREEFVPGALLGHHDVA